MKNLETKDKFLKLRAQDKSLRTIEQELGTDRRTLAKWEKKYKEELENRKTLELEALREKYWLTGQARIERFGGQLKRVMEELEQRDLSDVATPRLVDLALKLDARLRDETSTPAIAGEAGFNERKAQLKVKAKLTDELNEAPQVNFVQLPEYMELIQVIMRVLGPHPKLREEAAQALLEADAAHKEVGDDGNGKK